MELKSRIQELMQFLTHDIVERDSFIHIIFLSFLTNQSIYVYGRSGTGKSLLVRRVTKAFATNKTLKFGKRIQALPENLDEYEVMYFADFDRSEEEIKKILRIAFYELNEKALVITGCSRPERVFSEIGVLDKLNIALQLPEFLSAESLKQIFSTPYSDTSFEIPKELQITSEEKTSWIREANKITLSEDVLNFIGKLSEDCDKNHIYVSIRQWKEWILILKMIALCNERNEVILTDAFFFGMPIWNRTRNNDAMAECFFTRLEEVLLVNIPAVGNIESESERMRQTAEHLLNATDDIYETQMFAGESCIKYSVTIASESVPLYVPENYIGTHEEFHPINELRQKEKRVLCNFNGTSVCSISIDASVKSSGLRSSSYGTGKYEHFARLPAKILQMANPEKREANQKALQEFALSVESSIEDYVQAMISLKAIYKKMKFYTEDPFFNRKFYNKIQGLIKQKFEQSNKMIQMLKEVRSFLESAAV